MIKLILILVVSCITLSDACSCYLPQGWEKEAYCKAEFAGTIKVLSPEYQCGQMKICYSIVVVEQLRGIPITQTILQTASQSAACGVTLTQGNTYFLASNPIDSNIVSLHLCQLYADWSGLSHAEFKKKKQEYQQYQCGDEPIKPEEPKCVPPTKTCDLINYILCKLRELLKFVKLRSCKSD